MFVGFLKIIKDKPLYADLPSTRRLRFN